MIFLSISKTTMGCCTEEHGAQHQSDRFELRDSLEPFDF